MIRKERKRERLKSLKCSVEDGSLLWASRSFPTFSLEVQTLRDARFYPANY
jgi:hypothetical protein